MLVLTLPLATLCELSGLYPLLSLFKLPLGALFIYATFLYVSWKLICSLSGGKVTRTKDPKLNQYQYAEVRGSDVSVENADVRGGVWRFRWSTWSTLRCYPLLSVVIRCYH